MFRINLHSLEPYLRWCKSPLGIAWLSLLGLILMVIFYGHFANEGEVNEENAIAITLPLLEDEKQDGSSAENNKEAEQKSPANSKEESPQDDVLLSSAPFEQNVSSKSDKDPYTAASDPKLTAQQENAQEALNPIKDLLADTEHSEEELSKGEKSGETKEEGELVGSKNPSQPEEDKEITKDEINLDQPFFSVEQGFSIWQSQQDPKQKIADHKRPRIALILLDLGIDNKLIKKVLEELPSSITFSFSPYSGHLSEWTELAREKGHEFILSLPMEPYDYPKSDPGPYTLLTNQGPEKNLQKLEEMLGRCPGCIGVTTPRYSKLSTSSVDLLPILQRIQSKNLIFLDRHFTPRNLIPDMAHKLSLKYYQHILTLDEEVSRFNLDQAFLELERNARRQGFAIGTLSAAYPIALERLKQWLQTLNDKGFTLVNLSHIYALLQSKKG